MANTNILILACSASKVPQAGGKGPAAYVYDGPHWRMWRRFMADYPNTAARVHCFALSARYGLFPAMMQIDDSYNDRLPKRLHAGFVDMVADQISDRLGPVLNDAEFPNILMYGGQAYADQRSSAASGSVAPPARPSRVSATAPPSPPGRKMRKR